MRTLLFLVLAVSLLSLGRSARADLDRLPHGPQKPAQFTFHSPHFVP